MQNCFHSYFLVAGKRGNRERERAAGLLAGWLGGTGWLAGYPFVSCNFLSTTSTFTPLFQCSPKTISSTRGNHSDPEAVGLIVLILYASLRLGLGSASGRKSPSLKQRRPEGQRSHAGPDQQLVLQELVGSGR